jgi:hypothetical protein
MIALTVFDANVNAAPPTIGGATISGLPLTSLQLLPRDYPMMKGSYAIHGADAFSWAAYLFWCEQIQNRRTPVHGLANQGPGDR